VQTVVGVSSGVALKQERVAKHVSLREALVAKRLQGHPNVVNLIDAFKNGEHHGLLIMPSLKPYTRFGPLPRAVLRTRMQQLLQGLAWIHSNGFVHRDICPRNLMLHPEDGRVVIIDFGSACPWRSGAPSVDYYEAAVGYNAQHDPELSEYSLDSYSAGVILFEHLSGVDFARLLEGASEVVVRLRGAIRAANNQLRYPEWDLAAKLAAQPATQRLLPQDALKHPFFSST
jgi:serine/threonine protein kinase